MHLNSIELQIIFDNILSNIKNPTLLSLIRDDIEKIKKFNMQNIQSLKLHINLRLYLASNNLIKQ